MDIVTLLGTGAAICSTVSFAPQAWKVIKTGETKDISAISYAIAVTAFALWVSYGLMRSDWPLIGSNSICLILAAFILTMTLVPEPWRKALSAKLS